MDALDPARPATARHEASYELVTHLASGGMAELFIARRHGDPSAPHVVLKRVMPEQARNPHFVGMFLDEARLASRLHHPNIAQVLDVGRAGSSYYYTMEYVHGENVRDLLQLAVKQQVMVPLDVCVSVLIGAATGLHAAHETRDRNGVPLGIVHRDVSPSNVMISYEGEIKLVDFGVAKAADHTTETQSGTVKGKIAYLSPEQCTVQPVDRRSDVFSLGIVAYELVTRSRLFRRRSDYETMHAIVNDVVPPPSRMRAELPPAIDQVILHALERSPEDRPQSAAELADELAAVAARLGLPTGPAVLRRFMAELFGSRPLPWAHLENHDTAVIALAALAPGLVPSEREPLEASVSAAEVVIEVDKALSSSVDQAFAAVKTAIATPPREWGLGDDVPGVFTWPSRDEGVESVDRTVMTSSPPRRSAFDLPRVGHAAGTAPPAARLAAPPPRTGAAFLPTDTVVTPNA
ncbi:MAG TPA: serine/threonine-protein kinase, partial [Kofleriaceae bacterium]|nr:serine/threonine-protein kinase [Kofleriaceae bacterium]